MEIRTADFNDAGNAIAAVCSEAWRELEQVCQTLPLHLKASDQAGIQGSPIFDPVGTNQYFKSKLPPTWSSAIPIPDEYNFLGTDIDFGRQGLILEVQFSNYPFLLNNLLRGELFYQSGMPLAGHQTRVVVIITKAHMFPASNSTLYYEQAEHQLRSLERNHVFTVPIRLLGLFEQRNAAVPVKWTQYHSSRYSRTVLSQTARYCRITPGRAENSRCILKLLDAHPSDDSNSGSERLF